MCVRITGVSWVFVAAIAVACWADDLPQYRDCVAGEQAVMAVQALASTLDGRGALGGDRVAALARINAGIGAPIGATSHDDAYRPDEPRVCLQRAGSTLE